MRHRLGIFVVVLLGLLFAFNHFVFQQGVSGLHVTSALSRNSTGAVRRGATHSIKKRPVLRVVSDGVNHCFTNKAHPQQMSYWVKFSNGVRLNRSATSVLTPPVVYLNVDAPTKLRLPTTLLCTSQGSVKVTSSWAS